MTFLRSIIPGVCEVAGARAIPFGLVAGTLFFGSLAAQPRVVWSAFSSGYQLSSAGPVSARSFVGHTFGGSSSGNGIFLTSGPASLAIFSGVTTAVEQFDESIPVEYQLDQNYPNPFNPTTTIRFDIPRQGRVSIQVFSLLGQRMRVLIDEEKEAGRYAVVWDGRDDGGRLVPSGVYFYRMAGEDFLRSRKLVLLK